MEAALVVPMGSLMAGVDNRPEARLARLADAYLAARPASTANKYRDNLQAFARFLGCPSSLSADAMRPNVKSGMPGWDDYLLFLRQAANEASGYLVTRTRGEAFELVLAMKEDMGRKGRSASSVASMVTTLRGVVETAGDMGLCDWTLPKSLRVKRGKPYRDTRGPGVDGVRALLAESTREPEQVARKRARVAGEAAVVTKAAQEAREALARMEARHNRRARRNAAILRLMAGEALRRFEVTGLDLAHVDLAGCRLNVLRKGKEERQWLEIAPATAAALASWIDVRGGQAGPLFTNFDRAGKGTGRLSGVAVWQIVHTLGAAAGLGTVRPHGLRHTAITRALDLSGGDIAAVQEFSGHSDMKTLKIYDDNRLNRRSGISRLVGASF